MIIFFTQYTVGSNSVTCLQMSKTINLLYSICLLGFVNGGYVVWGGGGVGVGYYVKGACMTLPRNN